MSIIELPFGFPGRILRSPMPFSDFDYGDNLFIQFQQQEIDVVVLLLTDDSCVTRSGRNLRQLYQDHGLEVIHLPIRDFGVPALQPLEEAIQATIERACQGKDIVIHCYAGLGRSGMFLACMARRVLGKSAEEAVSWVRTYVPGAIETAAQVDIIGEFQEGYIKC